MRIISDNIQIDWWCKYKICCPSHFPCFPGHAPLGSLLYIKQCILKVMWCWNRNYNRLFSSSKYYLDQPTDWNNWSDFTGWSNDVSLVNLPKSMSPVWKVKSRNIFHICAFEPLSFSHVHFLAKMCKDKWFSECVSILRDRCWFLHRVWCPQIHNYWCSIIFMFPKMLLIIQAQTKPTRNVKSDAFESTCASSGDSCLFIKTYRLVQEFTWN